MKVKELRAFLKERGSRGYSTMKKKALEKKVREIQEEEIKIEYEKQLRENVLCPACLTEQRIQRKLDEKTFDQRALEGAIRTLLCEYCQHANLAQDGDDTFCVLCGALQPSDVL